MPLSAETRSRIENTLAEHRVVLFMKGDRQSPRCGFSAKAVGILDGLIPEYQSVDVLINFVERNFRTFFICQTVNVNL